MTDSPAVPQGLPDEAKAAIAEAVRIVREDKFESFVRGKMAPAAGDPDESAKNTAPPVKPETVKKPKKGGIWWPSNDTEDIPVDPPVAS